jgi:hypothetical protein
LNGVFWLENFLWEFSINNSPKANFGSFALILKFFRGAASFELRITKIGHAVRKLFDSTFKLEIPIPDLKRGGL